jgi:hypothetical protein
MVISSKWEQSDYTPITIINKKININSDFLTVHIRGDQHIGTQGFNLNRHVEICKNQQEKYRGHIFVIDTGDLIENNLKRSIGHNYDISIPDPAEQLNIAKEMITDLDKHLYGDTVYNKLSNKNKDELLHLGLIGNHEYRSRKEAGIWLNDELYSSPGIINGKVRVLLNLTIINGTQKKHINYIYLID